MRLVQGNKQAMVQFVAVATTTSELWSSLVSARIGGGGEPSSLRQAPTKIGYDTTIPSTPLRQQQQQKHPSFCDNCINDKLMSGLSSSSKAESSSHVIDRPGSESIDGSLKIQRVSSVEIRSAQQAINFDDHLLMHDDLGLLTAPVGTPALASAFTDDAAATEPATTIPVCKIGHSVSAPPVPASEYVKGRAFANNSGRPGITFDEKKQTVECHEHYVPEDGLSSCANLVFDHCNVRCEGNNSCYNAMIENAPQHIDCDGYQSCYGARLSTSSYGKTVCGGDGSCTNATIENAHHIDCRGYQSCYGAHLSTDSDGVVDCFGEMSCKYSYVGVHESNENFPIANLDCSGESSCESARAYNIKEAFCTGMKGCFKTELSGIHDSVLCQGWPHPNAYYYPTCGGEGAFIEAHEDSREKGITVTCSGDFACVGYGHDAYDQKEHPIYFDIDVGSSKNGELVCEGSFLSIRNDRPPTFVCRYIDVVQGCGNYVCHEPKGFDEDHGDLRTCNHIFSIHHHEMCYEGLRNSDVLNKTKKYLEKKIPLLSKISDER